MAKKITDTFFVVDIGNGDLETGTFSRAEPKLYGSAKIAAHATRNKQYTKDGARRIIKVLIHPVTSSAAV